MVRQIILAGLATFVFSAHFVARPVWSQMASDGMVDVDGVKAGETLNSPDLSLTSRGALLLCGGGDLPVSLLSKFHESGRGADGSLVVIPSASQFADSGDYTRWRQAWSEFPWKSVEILHVQSRDEAENDSVVSMLRNATAVWISGGDQERLATRYCGSLVEREIRGVMQRGGIVGGTSAGSAIASKVMIAGGNKQPRLNEGLDLLPRAIVDQHFSQRSRKDRLAKAVSKHPERIGIGIDEGTGLLITRQSAEVIGRGAVYVMRSLLEVIPDDDDDTLDHLSHCDHRCFEAGSSIAFDGMPLLED